MLQNRSILNMKKFKYIYKKLRNASKLLKIDRNNSRKYFRQNANDVK